MLWSIFAFIATQADTYAVTRAGYYAWRRRGESRQAEQDRRLTGRITVLFRKHCGRYGSPRIWPELKDEGWRVSRRPAAGCGNC
jgi:putative transposase